MKALVIYESLFGNTRRVAEAIAGGLGEGHEVTVLAAAEAAPAMLAGCDLLVLGAPTHGHGLPTPESRQGTLSQGVPEHIARSSGIRELLQALPQGRALPAAVFDTRLRGPRWLWGAASLSVARTLEETGFRLVVEPESFLLTGMRKGGLLAEGELERATAWGRLLARSIAPSPAMVAGG